MAETQSKSAAKKAEEAKAAASVEESAPPVPDAPAPSDPSFEKGRLIAESDQFVGVAPHVMAGALHADGRERLSVNQARDAVEAWLASPVKEG